jgi:glycosyltransferase involved in cell wall biosynthesis
LYANPDHVECPEGLGIYDFTYVPVRPPRPLAILSQRGQTLVNYLLWPLIRRMWQALYEPEACRRHQRAAYDVLLTMGTPPAFRIPGVPVFVWLQGPPYTESEAIRELKSVIVRTSGRTEYIFLKYFYIFRQLTNPLRFRDWDGVGCGSTWSVEALVHAGVPRDRVYAIPYPVDLDTFEPRSLAGTHQSHDPLIVFIGRLDPRKRIDLVVTGFQELSCRMPASRLLIVGSINYAKRQRRLIDRATKSESVVYIEELRHADIPDLMRAATVLVQPSTNENFGTAVAEALACGTPVVVGPKNGTRDYISGDSIILDRYTSSALARALEVVINRVRANTAAVQANARGVAEEHFAGEHVATRLEVALKQTIARSRTQA